MKKVLISVSLGAVMLVAGVAAFISSQGLDTIHVSKEQIVEKMQEKLPIKKSVAFYNVTIKDVTLELGEDNMNVLVDIIVVKKQDDCFANFTTKSARLSKFIDKFKKKCETASPEPNKIEVLAAGTLDYERPRVFFRPNGRDSIKIMTEFTDPFMKKHKQKADLILSEIAFGYLDRFPVFKFKNDTKQTIISAALESIEIHEDMVTINISYLELTKVLVGYIIVFILVVGLVIMMVTTGIIFPFMDS